MKQLVYISECFRPLDTEGVHDLLVQARSRNALNGVTGLLLYGGERFMQVLEGSVSAVDEIYASIRQDSRHINISTVYEAFTDHRSYESWHMAYRPLWAENGVEQAFTEVRDILDTAQNQEEPIKLGSVMSAFYREALNATIAESRPLS
ncbi:MAG: BLUF domain-containing protein [Pseudomonadota bacterium]